MTTITPTARAIGDDFALPTLHRRVLAILAPAPFLALALGNAVNPAELGGTAANEVASYAAHPAAASATVALSALFSLTLLPAAYAMFVATRPAAGRGTTFVTGYWLVAAGCGAVAPSTQVISWLTAHDHLDTAAGIAMSKALEGSPLYAALILPFAVAITLGRLALGVVLWRIRIAPRWMAGCLLLAVPVEWGGVAVMGNAGPVAAYLLTAIGFAGASVALTRASDR